MAIGHALYSSANVLAVSGSIGILTYLFFVMATVGDIKKVLEEEIRLLWSKLLSIKEKVDTL